ncbi:competence pheromone ComX [Metabacillus arenae]|uniref:Competence pheromone ComX n=1 Tax=Metabacillus arenae TaxID=2771434 RepID=A0A926RY54_9BACI|nr:competence pheromone ComX [Metabacillus arenae]MBD1382593.1 competence pheromone ComX [Metabacillus arenae]
MNEIIKYLAENQEEAISVLTGKASLLGVDAEQMLEIIRFFSNDQVNMVAHYWQ